MANGFDDIDNPLVDRDHDGPRGPRNFERNDRNDRNDRGGDRRGGGGRRFHRRKVCGFCREKIDIIDFKDVRLLANFIPERGKIMPRRISGSCATHQRMLTEAIKRARNIALLPFATD